MVRPVYWITPQNKERDVPSSAAAHAKNVYLHYTQAELDHAYTQAEWASNMAVLMDSWAKRGAPLRRADKGYSELAYGPDPCETLDLFGGGGRVVHLHLHGGAWHRQSKEDCSFIAASMRAQNVPFVVPEFGKLPDYRMPDVLDQIARATLWTFDRFVKTGRADGIVVSGHSSGAHMAALLASYNFGGALPVSALRAILCISGSYDLQPVMLSARRQYIHLSNNERKRLSPIERIAQMKVPLHLLFGSEESPEFIRQSLAYATALGRGGRLASCTRIEGANHFEMADQLGVTNSEVGQRLEHLLNMPHEMGHRPRESHSIDAETTENNKPQRRRSR